MWYLMSVRTLFPKGKEPRYTLEVLVALLPEATFNFTRDGIVLKALDPTKTAFIDLTFYATSLEDYYIEEETSVGLLFTTLKDVIKRVGATEKLELEVDRERNRFNLYVYPKRGKEVGLVRKFSLPIVQPFEEELPTLSEDFDAVVELDSTTLDDVLAMVEEVADVVHITIHPDKVVFRGVGEGGRAVETELPHDSEVIYHISTDDVASSKYSVETLRDISGKLKSLSRRVKLELSNKKPIKLTYEFTTGQFTVVVAPRVD